MENNAKTARIYRFVTRDAVRSREYSLPLRTNAAILKEQESSSVSQRGLVWRVVFSSSGDPSRPGKVPGFRIGPSIASILSAAAGSVFATVFPSDCRFCGTPLVKISRIPVCDTCLEAIRALDEPVCAVCGERLLSPAISRCELCRRIEPPYGKAVAYGGYEGGLRDLIHLLKYEQVRPAANVLGRMAAEAMLALPLGQPPVVIPVPLHAHKLSQRGFNQSELIARAALKAPALAGWTLNTSALVRRRATESQTGLTRHQRRVNIRGAFQVVRPNEILGKDIVLIDDVFTTGTTVTECARILRSAGAARVWVATVARVLKPEAAGAVASAVQTSAEEKRMPLARAAQA